MTDAKKVLVVDDESSVRLLLNEVLRKAGYEVFLAENGIEALETCRRVVPAVVIMDLRLPIMTGMEAFSVIHSEFPDIAVILLTAYGTVDTAVDAMRAGAFDYLVKPTNIAEVRIAVERAMSLQRLREEVVTLRSRLGTEEAPTARVVGRSAAMQNLYKTVVRIANTAATVLITGETGSGKELIAETIHSNSTSRDGPFIRVNCGALPEGLAESELFGHERGAFTGAVARRIGRFELADKGTLFLDEVGELSLAMQVKLLRAIQTKSFERVGGSESITADVRIVAATNRNLEGLIKEGRFREDLYYRLRVVPIEVPPLRARREDIAPLADHFLRLVSKASHRDPPHLTMAAIQCLEAYNWPGNVRELANIIERAVIMSSGIIDVNDIPLLDQLHGKHLHGRAFPLWIAGEPLKIAVRRLEHEIIAQALTAHAGNRAKTALTLGISRRALLYKLQELNGVLPNEVIETEDVNES